jgi:hypothetical protein
MNKNIKVKNVNLNSVFLLFANQFFKINITNLGAQIFLNFEYVSNNKNFPNFKANNFKNTLITRQLNEYAFQAVTSIN